MEGTRDFEQESRRESEGMQEGYEVRGDCLASLAKTIGTLLTNRETHETRERREVLYSLTLLLFKITELRNPHSYPPVNQVLLFVNSAHMI